MKKYILSPLCSAFVIPGLGQIINHDLKKGLTILALVFALFIGGIIKLVFMIKSILDRGGTGPPQPGDVMERLQGEGFTILWLLIIIFAVVWIYSVLDAFWTGKRLDAQEGGNSF